MHWLEIVSYLFVILVMVLVTIGALKAFRTYLAGQHHEQD